MNEVTLKILLDIYVEACIVATQRGDPRYGYDRDKEIRKLIKEFTDEVLQAGMQKVSAYGKNTHTYALWEAFLIQFRKL